MQKKIGVYSGRLVDPARLRIEDVHLPDIIRSLAFSTRFNGHTSRPYTIAEHSVHVSYLVDQSDPRLCMTALMHGAAEAYLGDVIRPLKASMPHFNEIEAFVLDVIGQALGFNPTYKADEVRYADDAMLRLEMLSLTNMPREVWGALPECDFSPPWWGNNLDPEGLMFTFRMRFEEIRDKITALSNMR